MLLAEANTFTIPDKSVVIRLMGGLGNQMFQYALGVAVSKRIGFTLMLDPHFFETDHLSNRRYELGAFGIEASMIDPITYMRFKFDWFPTIAEPHFHYWEGVLTPPSYTRYRLSGYWQTARYFEHIAQDIRTCFNLAQFSCSKTRAMEQQIDEASCAVCVHVRRRDLMRPEVYRLHGIVERAYYDKARTMLEDKYGDLHFFIFTDDDEHVREEFADWTHVTFVHSDDHYQDMMLMTRCQHHIIGNSTYGWWGAWLNPSSQKHVIAPKQWFAPSVLATCRMGDLYIDGWSVI